VIEGRHSWYFGHTNVMESANGMARNYAEEIGATSTSTNRESGVARSTEISTVTAD
jgi:hypothetical protein